MNNNNLEASRSQTGFTLLEIIVVVFILSLLVAIVASLFVGPSMFLIAYFTDFPRGYYIALIMSIAVFSFVWFWQAIYLIIGGLLIMIPGIYLLTRFLQAYPIPPVEIIDG